LFCWGQAWRTFLRARPQTVHKFGRNISRARENFDEHSKVLESSIIIINYYIISVLRHVWLYCTIDVQYNYYISNKGHLEECGKAGSVAVTGCRYFLFQKTTLKQPAHCHVFAQSPPERRPNDKYPVNTSHRSGLCKNISLPCCLVATVIHIQSVRCQICV
jgi:hypothetical protein